MKKAHKPSYFQSAKCGQSCIQINGMKLVLRPKTDVSKVPTDLIWCHPPWPKYQMTSFDVTTLTQVPTDLIWCHPPWPKYQMTSFDVTILTQVPTDLIWCHPPWPKYQLTSFDVTILTQVPTDLTWCHPPWPKYQLTSFDVTHPGLSTHWPHLMSPTLAYAPTDLIWCHPPWPCSCQRHVLRTHFTARQQRDKDWVRERLFKAFNLKKKSHTDLDFFCEQETQGV